MPAAIFAVLRVAATWLGRAGIAAYAVNEFRNFYNDNQESFEGADKALTDAGVSEEEKQKLVAALTYDKVESEGKSPDDFWAGLSEEEREKLQFSPESLRQDMGRTKFLGLSSIMLFIGALAAAGVGAIRGIPIILSTLAKIRDARAAGATASQLMVLIEEGKMAGIAKVWVPAAVSTFLGASGWWSASMGNNFNDASLWGRIFLGQAYDDYVSASEKAAELEAKGVSGTARAKTPITIIRMVDETKPEQFIGTLFSSKLGKADSFERKVDDEITDMDDLTDDVKLNLNRWLETLPGRMGYSVVVRQDPVDELGTKQSGIWATLTIFMTHISGKTTPIDTILLGPVNPKTRLELTRRTRTIENEIEGFIDATTVREIQVPNGAVDIFDTEGARVTPSTVAPATVSEAVEGIVSTERQQGETESEHKERLEKTVKELEAKKAELEQKAAKKPPTEGARQVTPTLKASLGDTLKVDTGGSTLNVRIDTGIGARIIDKLQDGEKVEVAWFGGKRDGYTWINVKLPKGHDAADGWVAAEFLKR